MEVLLKHVRQPLPSIRTIVPSISAAVDGVLQMALQKRADDRFASAEELSNAFYAAVTVAPIASPVASPASSMKSANTSCANAFNSLATHASTHRLRGLYAWRRASNVQEQSFADWPLDSYASARCSSKKVRFQFPAHPQGLPRVTKQLSPSLPFESNYPGNTHSSTIACEHGRRASVTTAVF